MAVSDFDPFKQPGESDEQLLHHLEETILTEDWTLRFQANSAEFCALGTELVEEQDPDRVLSLAEQPQNSLIRGLGSGVLSLWQRDVIAERQKLETDFGSQDQT